MEIIQKQTIEYQIHQDVELINALAQEVGKVIVGNKSSIETILLAILCNGHILLEGVPGIAKTTLIKTIAQALGLDFKRIQFTPDLLPSDLIGTLVYNPKTLEFETKKGPLFTNIVLADEINRAPAKVQSALLEAMQEHQVTIGSHTYKLEEPFLVFATQNPVEHEGTYHLPEAQVDRFMFKLNMGYPTHEEEQEIISRSIKKHTVSCILNQEDILRVQETIKQVYVDPKILRYIVDIVSATRDPQKYNLKELGSYINYGASPRASLAINYAGRAHAFMQKRHFVTPDDVKAVAHSILRHRIILNYQAHAEKINSDTLISKILASVYTP
ncbi:MAG TPA: MoxR family ATPase [Candidatus Babeliales bacterium]|nr:MoxR family ATPase [Candidatus Babeliales bacterium]